MTAYQPFHVSIKDAAQILGVSPKTIYRMRRDGELKLSKLRGRTFVPIAELDRLRDTSLLQIVGEPVRDPEIRRPKKRKLFPRDR